MQKVKNRLLEKYTRQKWEKEVCNVDVAFIRMLIQNQALWLPAARLLQKKFSQQQKLVDSNHDYHNMMVIVMIVIRE